jgi:hypothetical protein
MQLTLFKGDPMRKNLLLTSLAITLAAGNLHASETNGDNLAKNTLTERNVQDMKRQHRVMTQAALSEVGMEARRKLMASKNDEIYHEMVNTGDINISESDRLATKKFNH